MKLPHPFTSVEVAVPSDNLPVLVIRQALNRSSSFEVLTARYYPMYRPLNPWVDSSYEAVTASGPPVLGWAYSDWLKA
jgi:hypothetical protein